MTFLHTKYFWIPSDFPNFHPRVGPSSEVTPLTTTPASSVTESWVSLISHSRLCKDESKGYFQRLNNEHTSQHHTSNRWSKLVFLCIHHLHTHLLTRSFHHKKDLFLWPSISSISSMPYLSLSEIGLTGIQNDSQELK